MWTLPQPTPDSSGRPPTSLNAIGSPRCRPLYIASRSSADDLLVIAGAQLVLVYETHPLYLSASIPPSKAQAQQCSLQHLRVRMWEPCVSLCCMSTVLPLCLCATPLLSCTTETPAQMGYGTGVGPLALFLMRSLHSDATWLEAPDKRHQRRRRALSRLWVWTDPSQIRCCLWSTHM